MAWYGGFSQRLGWVVDTIGASRNSRATPPCGKSSRVEVWSWCHRTMEIEMRTMADDFSRQFSGITNDNRSSRRITKPRRFCWVVPTRDTDEDEVSRYRWFKLIATFFWHTIALDPRIDPKRRFNFSKLLSSSHYPKGGEWEKCEGKASSFVNIYSTLAAFAAFAISNNETIAKKREQNLFCHSQRDIGMTTQCKFEQRTKWSREILNGKYLIQ